MLVRSCVCIEGAEGPSFITEPEGHPLLNSSTISKLTISSLLELLTQFNISLTLFNFFSMVSYSGAPRSSSWLTCQTIFIRAIIFTAARGNDISKARPHALNLDYLHLRDPLHSSAVQFHLKSAPSTARLHTLNGLHSRNYLHSHATRCHLQNEPTRVKRSSFAQLSSQPSNTISSQEGAYAR